MPLTTPPTQLEALVQAIKADLSAQLPCTDTAGLDAWEKVARVFATKMMAYIAANSVLTPSGPGAIG